MDIKEDIIDDERSTLLQISPEADDGTGTQEVIYIRNIPTSPIRTVPSFICKSGKDEPKFTNKENNNNSNHEAQCSCDVPSSGTETNSFKPLYSPRVTINWKSLLNGIKTENETFPDATLQADETNDFELDLECYANAPPSPILNMQFPKVSFGASSSFLIDREDSDTVTSKVGSPQSFSPVLSMQSSKFAYKASDSSSTNAVPKNHAETGMHCPPEVSINPSSFESSVDPQSTSDCLVCPNPESSFSQEGLAFRVNSSSLLISRSVSTQHDEQLSPTVTTSRNLDSGAFEASTNVLNDNEKNTPQKKFSHCTPEVIFNPSSLIFSDDPQRPSEHSETPNPDVPVQLSSNICFNSPSLFENMSVSSSEDEAQLPPADDTSKKSELNQQAVSSNPPINVFENSCLLKPSRGLRGILKIKKALSPNEKIITDCLKLLCKTSNNDRHEVRDKIRSSAKEVFRKLCFEQFFQKGECIISSCDDTHHYKSHIFTHSNEEMWNASLYVICHAAKPNLQVVENLVQHYTSKGDTIRSLLLAKCIGKVKDIDRLELAHFIINKLSGAIPPRDVITVILMLNFPDLCSSRYKMLMEGLGVFEQNTADYSELMDFLNFQDYVMTAGSLIKLMKDAMKYSGKGSFVESISGFLKRLNPNQKNEIQPTVNDFVQHFGISLASDQNEYGQDEQPPQKRSKTGKKKVIFATHPEVREFEVADCPRDIQSETESPGFSDGDSDDDDDLDIHNFYSASEPPEDIVKRVFGGLCCSLILHGRCANTMCRLTHDFGKAYFRGLSSSDVSVAIDFILDESKSPSFEILKIFIEFLAESLQNPVQLNEIARILKFRKLSLRLSTSDSLRLTRMVISVLSKQIGLWDAIEKVLVPIPVELEDPDDGRFLFDEELLHFILSEANKNKSSILRCVSGAIMEQLAMLPPCNSGELTEVATSFVEKFLISGRKLDPFPDILPVKTIMPNRFASELKVALYQGVPSKYFMATIMMKQTVDKESCLKDQAVDVLYTFLLSNFDRARVLTHLFDNCRYFDRSTKSSVEELFGVVALKTAIRLYESENFAGAAELFTILEQNQLKLNLFVLLARLQAKMTELDLATVYCTVKVDTDDRKYLLKTFFTRCVDPLISSGSACPPALGKLTAKMFRVFTSGLLVEETLELYNGITSRQKSLVHPFNMEEFVEPTLRCTFSRLCDSEIRRKSISMYLEIVDHETPVTLQKVTHRSMFLIAVMLITQASQEFEVKGYINIIHPVIHKMLVTCIKEGVYFDIRTSDINIYSSQTAKEIEVYLLWWFFLYIRARKRRGYQYFNPITIRILQDCIQDNSHLPLHPSLRNVNVSVMECAERVTSVIKNAIAEPIEIIPGRERGVFELHPATVRAMSQTACNIMLQHGYITAEVDKMCTFCFDKQNVQLAEQLP